MYPANVFFPCAANLKCTPSNRQMGTPALVCGNIFS